MNYLGVLNIAWRNAAYMSYKPGHTITRSGLKKTIEYLDNDQWVEVLAVVQYNDDRQLNNRAQSTSAFYPIEVILCSEDLDFSMGLIFRIPDITGKIKKYIPKKLLVRQFDLIRFATA